MAMERLSFFDRLQALCVVTSCTVAGALTLWGPGEWIEGVRTEISESARLAIGWGLLGYGALFALMALLASGRSANGRAFASRLLGLLVAVGVGVLLWLVGRTIGADVRAAWLLKDGAGTSVQATVPRPGMRGVPRASRSVTIRYAGQQRQVRLPDEFHGRRTVPVLFLEEDPDVVLVGRAGAGFGELIDAALGPSGKYAWAAGVLCLGFWFLVGLKRLLR